MRNTSDSNMINQKFIVTAHPICYVKPFTPLTPQIDISRNRTDEFCEPIFRSLSDEDVQLSNEYVRELQAQGVDKLVNALQDALNLLHERDCASTGVVTSMLKDEIRSCKAFARRLRHPVTASNLCDSHHGGMSRGCSSTCATYREVLNHE